MEVSRDCVFRVDGYARERYHGADCGPSDGGFPGARGHLRGRFALACVVGLAAVLALAAPSSASAVTVSVHGATDGGTRSHVLSRLSFADSSDASSTVRQSMDVVREESLGDAMAGFPDAGWNYDNALPSSEVTAGTEGFIIAAETYGRHSWSGSAYNVVDAWANRSNSSFRAGSASFAGALTDATYAYGGLTGAPVVTGSSSYVATRGAIWVMTGHSAVVAVGYRTSGGWLVTSVSISGANGQDVLCGMTRRQSTLTTASVCGLDLNVSGGANSQEVKPGGSSRQQYRVVAEHRRSRGYAVVSRTEAELLTAQLLDIVPVTYATALKSGESSAAAVADAELETPNEEEAFGGLDSVEDARQAVKDMFADAARGVEGAIRPLFWFLEPLEVWQ